MTQPSSDYDLDAAISGLQLRTEINTIIQAILTGSSGGDDPPETFPFMRYMDTDETPTGWYMRNEANDAWIKVGEFNLDDTITLFSDGAAIPSLGAEQTFTETQSIFETDEPGVLDLASNISDGISAAILMGGRNDALEDIVMGQILGTVQDDTNGSEDFFIQWEVLLNGVMTPVVRIDGGFVTVTGILEADTLQQANTDLDDLIEAAINSVGLPSFTNTTRTIPTHLTAGDMNRFTGSSPSTITIAAGTAGRVYGLVNDGTAAITFVASGTTIVGSLGLAIGKLCNILYVTSTKVYIFGQNA